MSFAGGAAPDSFRDPEYLLLGDGVDVDDISAAADADRVISPPARVGPAPDPDNAAFSPSRPVEGVYGFVLPGGDVAETDVDVVAAEVRERGKRERERKEGTRNGVPTNGDITVVYNCVW